MTLADFINILKSKGYPHKLKDGGVLVTGNGYVDLDSLTSLPKGTKFENQGSVYLRSLTGSHDYLAKKREFRHVDGRTMIFACTKSYAGYSVHSARYFSGGAFSDMRKCYVAESDGHYAHGETMKSAVEDLQYKLDDHADKAGVRASRRKRN